MRRMSDEQRSKSLYVLMQSSSRRRSEEKADGE